MASLRVKSSMRNKSGLTLIEVLIALAILSIALTAIIKVTSQNIRDTLYLQNKTIANWVGNYIISEIKIGLIKIPNDSNSAHEITMLNQTWQWQAQLRNTRVKQIKEINVAVAQGNQENPLINLTSYLYVG